MVRLENNCQQRLKLVNEEKQKSFWKFQCCKVIIGLLIGALSIFQSIFKIHHLYEISIATVQNSVNDLKHNFISKFQLVCKGNSFYI